MAYSIGEVAKRLNMTIHTLRYYDKEGMLPSVERTDSGRRIFSEDDIELLEIIQCLKITGMPVKDIKDYIVLCSKGDETLEQRLDLFKERKEAVQNQIKALNSAMEIIEYKCEYYTTAIVNGCESTHK